MKKSDQQKKNDGYFNKDKTLWGCWLAWANMAVPLAQ